MRKQLQAEKSKADQVRRIKDLEDRKKAQSNKVIELRSKIEAINANNLARREVAERRRRETEEFLEI